MKVTAVNETATNVCIKFKDVRTCLNCRYCGIDNGRF